MSKFFNAIKNSTGEVADFSLPVIESAAQASPGAGTSTLADVAPPLPESRTSAGAVAVASAPTPAIHPQTGRFRSVPLRVAANSPVLPFDPNHDRSRPSEEYRVIRTRLTKYAPNTKVVMISSPGPGDGKSVNAVNIACALALKSHSSVLLVDADLRRSRISKVLGIEDLVGLTDLLSGSAAPVDAIVQAQQSPALHILPAGRGSANPAELLDSPRWNALIQEFRDSFEYVIIDAPPMYSGVADYDLIQLVCDGIIVVVRQDQTSRDACFTALKGVPANKLIGVVLNCVEDFRWWRSAYNYRRYYYET